ncbi:MAG: LacI family DNA-binding transcriptional regulator [Armatimonadetes bacterium]|nr:LacI family DNA-binding transcriptional regulator [Armatimonadota bacterium]
MRVTQQDIARLASVSQATVSRVVAGDARVEDEIRERVLGVMKSHNYRPDVRARSLRQQRTHLVGLVMKRDARDLQGDPFFSMFVSEILDYLSNTPYHLCVDIASSAVSQTNVYDELLRTRRVDGLILVESEPRDNRATRLQADHFPFVLVGNPGEAKHLHSVDNDNVLAGAIATQHLIEQGYRKVGFIAGPSELTVSKDRVEGYCQTVSSAGLRPRIWYSDFGFDAARSVGLQALSSEDRPDSLVVLDDFMAMGVVDAARELRLAVPQSLGIVSFNDTHLCNLVPGGLTSVSLNIREVVRRACGTLLRIVEDRNEEPPSRVVVPCALKVRGSSLRTPEVALA